ncbi:hypothetical protein FA95DRAFT_1595630 [Auriscalpium vulgare]|uniref:Uncharacterized protein n=1 Tax=Auriscalpium vulgare TaxID=40419 RepID=A0ACB8RTR7_9AGAM|nr:hypothetical protein FA95DRAFT_1595630 [Auriscalpium vulgare]
MPTLLSSLPVEILLKIVLFLGLRDIASCQLSCERLHTVVSGSAHVQYRRLLRKSGLCDDMEAGMSHAERLRTVERREEAWGEITFRSTRDIDVPFQPTGIYDFTGDVLLLGTAAGDPQRRTTGYAYMRLPSVGEDGASSLSWVHNEMQNEPGLRIVDIGMALHEHDMIALVTSREEEAHDNDWAISVLELRFVQFSTSAPHPKASLPVIPIARKSVLLGHCSVLVEVVGDHLALLVTYPWARGEMEDMFFLVNWKRGIADCLRVSDWGMYSHFAFLSEDTLVFPNSSARTLEINKIILPPPGDPYPPTLRVVCVLALPTMTEHSLITRVDCRGEPGPASSPTPLPAPRQRPFRNTSEDAVILFNYLVQDARRPLFGNLRAFSFVVHRRTLLSHASRAAGPRGPPARERGILDLKDVHLAEEPRLTAPPEVTTWDAWGPASTRWFEHEFPEALRWITTSAGQRCVAKTHTGPSPLVVRDFNPHNVGQLTARIGEAAGSLVLPNGNTTRVVTQPTIVSNPDVFTNDFVSELPYCETTTAENFGYDGVLMDEERILGLQVREDEIGIHSLEVHVLG